MNFIEEYTPQQVKQTCENYSFKLTERTRERTREGEESEGTKEGTNKGEEEKINNNSLTIINENNINNFIELFSINLIFDFMLSPIGLSTNSFTSVIPFNSLFDEAGFLFLAHAIDFGSGFRPYLHKYRNGQGAWLTIRDGLIKLGNKNPTCDSLWLKNLTINEIEEFFDLSYPELKLLAQYIHEDLHEIGTVLDLNGYSTPGQFIQSNLHLNACGLVNLFVTYFPLTFRDEYILNGNRICLFKKAQLVVSEIYLKFSPTNPLFQFNDIDSLTAFVDNVVVAMLRKYEILQCTPELNEKISNEIYIEKGSEEEISLRACGVAAVELIVQKYNEKQKQQSNERFVNSQIVCNWLWGCLGKDGENRKFPRHLAPSTSYY